MNIVTLSHQNSTHVGLKDFFLRGKLNNIPSFADLKLEVVNHYTSLGVTYNFIANLMLQNEILNKRGVGECLRS